MRLPQTLVTALLVGGMLWGTALPGNAMVRQFSSVQTATGQTAAHTDPNGVALPRTQPTSDPSLQQTIDEDRQIADEQAVLNTGHIDLGPKFDNGEWTWLINDDAARTDPNAVSMWRRPQNTVLQLTDAAILSAPDDPAYSFLGVSPGADLWVVPQTQDPDVVWLGWNTQDPQVMSQVDRGVTMALAGVQGPGALVVFLQSGSFEAPTVVWDSRLPNEPAWVDVNTHTHATWAFTEPGIYLVNITVQATLLDGSTVSDTQPLRLAVGTSTSTAEAFAAVWSGPTATAEADTQSTADDTSAVWYQNPVFLATAGGGLLFIAGAILTVRRSARARREALEQ